MSINKLPKNIFTIMTWNDITVGQFLDLRKLAVNKELNEMEQLEKAISIIYDKTEREVEEMQMGEFTKLSKEAGKFLTEKIPGKAEKFVIANGNKYRIIYDPTKLMQRQYVEVVFFGENPIENLHHLMASIVRPVKRGQEFKNNSEDHAAIANDMLDAPIVAVYHTCVFFCNLYKNLMQATPDFLANQMKGIMSRKELENLIAVSTNVTDGYIQPPV